MTCPVQPGGWGGSGFTWLLALHVHTTGLGRALSSPSSRFLICEMGHNSVQDTQPRGQCGSVEALPAAEEEDKPQRPWASLPLCSALRPSVQGLD